MAELNESALQNFTAATAALTLTQCLRLSRNNRYYSSDRVQVVERDKILQKVLEIRRLAFILHNIIAYANSDHSPFYVSIAGRIHDNLEEIHRKILFFEADCIREMIPLIDEQRRFWKDLHAVEFYGEDLLARLDHNIPETLSELYEMIEDLPRTASL